jgi:hypothetical protein
VFGIRITAADGDTFVAKQNALVSGTNIKTVNSSSLLGSGDLAVGDVTLSGTQTLTNKTITGGTVNPTTLQEGGVAAVIQTDIGTAPNEIPLNQYLGSAAYVDINSFVTPAGTETLTNKTLGSGTLFGAAINGQDNDVARIDLRDYGYVYFNSGTTNALNYENGSHQRWAPNTGAQTLSITNWPPSGNLGELLIEGVNLGAATITWPTINWITSTGATTTTFSSNGVTLQTSGIDWVLLWTRDAGTTIYGKIVR